MAEEYSYTESMQMACSGIYWSCDCFLFFFLLSNGICAKTSHQAKVSCLQWVTNMPVCKSEQQAESALYFEEMLTYTPSTALQL